MPRRTTRESRLERHRRVRANAVKVDVTERFLRGLYGAFDVRFVAEEFITGAEHVVAIGRVVGTTRKAGVPVDVPFVHIWTVREGYLQRLRAFTDTALLARALAKG